MGDTPTDTTLVSLGLHPIVSGLHPDPTICRRGEDYYLAASSFEYFPAVPILHSRDLVHWTLLGNALTRPSQFSAGRAAASGGVFAPTLRWHDGLFWLVTTNVSSSTGEQLLFTAEDARGPWSPPTVVTGLRGIDPDIAWDESGQCLITYSSTDPELPGILQARVDPTTGVALEAPRQMWSGTGLAFPEAPHLYRRGGHWYLLVSEGGTERGHAVSVARGPAATGPFTGAPHNPVLSHRSTTHPVQNTGHADLVEKPDGTWAAVYLGVRPHGTTPKFHVNGRETFLAGVTWEQDWPVFDEDHYSASATDTPFLDHSFVDRFSGPALDPRWVGPGRSIDALGVRSDGGGLLLRAPGDPGVDDLVATRVRDPRWRFEARFDLVGGGASRTCLRLDDRHWYAVHLDDRSAWGVLRIGPVTHEVGRRCSLAGDDAVVSLCAVEPRHGGPDDVQLAVTSGGETHVLGTFDGRYLSTEVAGGFTGRVVGFAATREPVLLREVSYTTLTTP